MPQTVLLGLILNAGLLLALTVVFDLLSARTHIGRTWVGRTLAGISAGLIGIGLMATPIHVEPGVQFDTRSVLLSVAGVFLGPWTTAVAVALTAAFRVWLGGAWGIGVLVILASGAIGLLWRARLSHLTARRPELSLYGMGITVHIVMLTLIALIPDGAGMRALPQVALPVIVLYPLATVALGMLLTQRSEREAAMARERDLQAHYLQAQKMEGVGRLAAGVAHDFNNLLTIINGSAELAAGSLPEDHPAREDLRQIVAAGDRAGALTRQLLAFSRQAVVMPVVLDLDEVIDGFRPMLARVLENQVVLQVRLGLPATRVRADAGQLEQVILNLAINARDAMPAGGGLTIETAAVTLSAAEAGRLRPPVKPGRYARVSVIDTGEGMDAATLDRMFEPFFTTKPIGKGTGLGLATVVHIVEKSGGGARATSEPGRGARFDVFLPEVLEQETTPAAVAVSATPAVQRQPATVLLVEDDLSLRQLSERVLRNAGFAVTTATNGREGLEMAVAHAGPLDLVITDLVMPEMGGRELGMALATRRPDVPVLYTSGYTNDAGLAAWLRDTGAAFLSKPYSAAELVRVASAVIETARSKTPEPAA